tara:strand:- start:507 stop:1085 length:579 start_codon:yes stop_codon:yes gene_type:complete
MNFISINTCTNICSVAFFEDGEVRHKEKDNIKDHSEYIAIFTKDLIGEKIKKIDFIAIAIGPGSYSGLKAGLSFAKGLSLSLKVPILPIETFSAMNIGINEKNKYYISIYSHRDYLYVQEYLDKKSIDEPKCLKYEELKNIKIFGYGLNNIPNLYYDEIRPSSIDVGKYVINNYNKIIKEKKQNISPIYLSV